MKYNTTTKQAEYTDKEISSISYAVRTLCMYLPPHFWNTTSQPGVATAFVTITVGSSKEEKYQEYISIEPVAGNGVGIQYTAEQNYGPSGLYARIKNGLFGRVTKQERIVAETCTKLDKK